MFKLKKIDKMTGNIDSSKNSLRDLRKLSKSYQ